MTDIIERAQVMLSAGIPANPHAHEITVELIAELKAARAEVEQLRADIPALLAAANAPEAER